MRNRRRKKGYRRTVEKVPGASCAAPKSQPLPISDLTKLSNLTTLPAVGLICGIGGGDDVDGLSSLGFDIGV